MTSEDILLIHHKLDLILCLLSKPQSLPKLTLPGATTDSNATCPVCSTTVKIQRDISSGELQRQCACLDALGIRSLKLVDPTATPTPPAWGKNYED